MGHNGKDIPLDPTGRHDDDKILWEKVTQSVRRMNPQPAFQTPKQRGAPRQGHKKQVGLIAPSLFKLVKQKLKHHLIKQCQRTFGWVKRLV